MQLATARKFGRGNAFLILWKGNVKPVEFKEDFIHRRLVKRRISVGKISGIALLMEIDLEPLHLPDVLDVVLHPQDPERSVETYRGTMGP